MSTRSAEFTLVVPEDDVDRYLDWQECVAFRFVRVDETTVKLEVSNDLERVTRPEGS